VIRVVLGQIAVFESVRGATFTSLPP
jgi:hypothetical protein